MYLKGRPGLVPMTVIFKIPGHFHYWPCRSDCPVRTIVRTVSYKPDRPPTLDMTSLDSKDNTDLKSGCVDDRASILPNDDVFRMKQSQMKIDWYKHANENQLRVCGLSKSLTIVWSIINHGEPLWKPQLYSPFGVRITVRLEKFQIQIDPPMEVLIYPTSRQRLF